MSNPTRDSPIQAEYAPGNAGDGVGSAATSFGGRAGRTGAVDRGVRVNDLGGDVCTVDSGGPTGETMSKSLMLSSSPSDDEEVLVGDGGDWFAPADWGDVVTVTMLLCGMGVAGRSDLPRGV